MKAIRATLHKSDFFQSHEVIGSSLLFVHDRTQASVWLIDFAKTIQLPSNTEITHNNKWSVGNHEDGYLIGINNLIGMFEDMVNEPAPSSLSPSSSDEKISGHSLSSSRSHSLENSTAPVLPAQDSASGHISSEKMKSTLTSTSISTTASPRDHRSQTIDDSTGDVAMPLVKEEK